MFTAEQFRAKAAESAELIRNTDVPSEIRKFQRSMESFSLLAQNEDWLADNYDKMIRSQDVLSKDDGRWEAARQQGCRQQIEEHILRCLGAAVIMQWNTIPSEAATRAFRYRRLAGGRTTNGHAERPDCSLLT